MSAQTAPETKNGSLELDLPLRNNSQHLSRRRPVDKTKSNQNDNSAPNSRKSTLTQNNANSHNTSNSNRNSIKYDHVSKPKNTNRFSSGASNTGIQPSKQPSEYSNLNSRNNSRKSTDKKDVKLPGTSSNKANSRRDSGDTSVGSGGGGGGGVHSNSDDGKNNLMPGALALKNLENGKHKTGSGARNNSSSTGTGTGTGNHKTSISKQHRKSTAGSARSGATIPPPSEAPNSNLKKGKGKKPSMATDSSGNDGEDAHTDEDDDGSDNDDNNANVKRKQSALELARQKFALLNVDLKEATLTFQNHGEEYDGEDQEGEAGEEEGEGVDENWDGDGYEPGATSVTFSQIDKFSSSTPERQEAFRNMSAKKSKIGIGLRRVHSLENSEDLKLTISAELYRGIEILTNVELEEAKANRRFRLDAYCLGRSMLAPPMEEVEPQVPRTSPIKEESIESYDTFWETLHEIIEENNSNHLIEQIICVFTADVVRNKKTWSEDCNLLEAAIEFLLPYMKPTGYLLWIRCGNQKEWKDKHNPFRTDKVLMLNTLPTLKVWNTDKRLAGNRLFQMDNLCVMLDD